MSRKFNREKRLRDARRAPICACGGFTQKADHYGHKWICTVCERPVAQQGADNGSV